MYIDEVIEKLEEYKTRHGNTKVRVAGGHDYWGTLYNEVDDFTLRFEKKTTTNPKKFEETPAVVFCFGYDV